MVQTKPADHQKKLNKLLLEACEDNNDEIIRQLINDGADINAKGPFELTPLHQVIINHKKEALHLVQILINAGSDIDATDISNRTPLFYAASKNMLDVVSFLIEHGADIHIKDNDGFDACSFFRRIHNHPIASYIEKTKLNMAISAANPMLELKF